MVPVNGLDYGVLVATILGIAAYGVWRTRGRRTLGAYLKGDGDAGWLVVGLSVMATQASAVTFLSTPGQGYQSGLGFVQNYFGAPLALIAVSVFLLPVYRRLKVYTAYEYLGQRFDAKTRLLAAGLFLLQRGVGAGITVYAPAIVLSTVFGWRLDLTIICSGVVATAYTVAGGSDAVTHTQKLQFTVILAGMAAAFGILLHQLTATHTLSEVLALAGQSGKLRAVDFSLSPSRRYTLWSGLLGGGFLALSYFGTDQSQVQRYIGARSLRQGRLGLMFNAVFKIPMQFGILLLGVLLFVFYETADVPVMFNTTAWNGAVAREPSLEAIARAAAADHRAKRDSVEAWLRARDPAERAAQLARVDNLAAKEAKARADAVAAVGRLGTKSNDADYVFIRFILDHLPHGLIGLLVTAFFAATLSSKAAELNALASTTVVDVFRYLAPAGTTDARMVLASKWFTVLWGGVAMAFALFASLSENLIQAVNIVGSIFYGVVLGLFLTALFLRRVGGTAAFTAAVVSQAAVIVMYLVLDISYLWYNAIGCVLCVAVAALLQLVLPGTPQEPLTP